MRRITRILLGIVISLTIFASYLMHTASAQSSETVLSLWTRYPDDQIQPRLDAYNARLKAAGKNLRVVHTSVNHDEFVARFTEAVKVGKAPDLVAFDLVDGPRYNVMGALLDVTDRFNQLAYKDTLNKAMLHLGTWQGRVYAPPLVAIVSVLYYNRKLFQHVGLDPNKPPATWDELLADAQKLTSEGSAGFELWCGSYDWLMFSFMPYVWANGGKFLSDDGSKAMLDDPKTVETVQFFADMANKYKVTSPAGTPEGCTGDGTFRFDKGTIAMVPRASDAFGFYIQANPPSDLKIRGTDLGVTLFPGKTVGSHSAFIGGDLIAISAGSKYPDEAWNFIQFLLSAEVQNDKGFLQAGFVPVRSDLLDNPIYAADPRYKVFAQALADGYVPFTTRYHDLYAPFQVGMKAALNGEKSVADALQAANAEMQKVIDAK